MRELILSRIEKFKSDESGFNSFEWANIFVSYTKDNKSITLHISDVDFNILNDDDLVRLFEYTILQKTDISNQRVRLFFRRTVPYRLSEHRI